MSALVHPEYLVSTDWLAQHLHDPAVRIVDCTTHLPPRPDFSLYDVVSGRADYEKAHIPGAIFVDIEHDVSTPHPRLHFMLPSPEAFAAAMGRFGIGDDTHVIVYATANHWWATRLWWMLRVFGHDRASVLDGGFHKWQREERPVEAALLHDQARQRVSLRAIGRSWSQPKTMCWPRSDVRIFVP